MLELLTGGVLAVSAGLNAYIPLLTVGLLTRFTSLIELPDSWQWLQNEWTLGILAILLAVEFLVDKIPTLDTINDVLQTVVRPASGGIAISVGSIAKTPAVSEPSAFFQGANIWIIAAGVVLALIPHVLKAGVRIITNVFTFGTTAAINSVLEDFAALAMVLLAVVVPILALVAVVLTFVLLWRRLRRARKKVRDPRSNVTGAPN